MNSTSTICGWDIHIDTGPEWWFVKIGGESGSFGDTGLAEEIWTSATNNDISRIVIELDETVIMTSVLIGELVLLHKRACLEAGVVRLCGWSETHYGVLEQMRLGGRFPNYTTREAAVLGHAP